MEFLEPLLKAAPSRIHTTLTDDGIQFADQPRGPQHRPVASDALRHDLRGKRHRAQAHQAEPYVDERLEPAAAKAGVERMNRTIKEATVKRFHYKSHDQLRTHLADFMAAYNFARRLKTLSGLTPYEYIAKIWTSELGRFIVNSIH